MTEKENKEKLAHPEWPYFRLPPFSPVAIHVMQLVNEEDASTEELSKLIASDQAFAGAVLTLANSALYAHRFPVTDVQNAIARVGLKSLQGLCMNVAMVTYVGKYVRLEMIRTLWAHNLACGFIAEVLSTGTGMDHGSAFTCGLMHDVGRLALAVLKPDEYVQLLESHKGTPASMLEREKEMFGFDHCEAGHELVRSWSLPAPFDVVATRHHGPRRNEDMWDLADLTQISCRMADSIGFAAFPGCEAAPYADLLKELPSPAVAALYPDAESLASEIKGRIELMQEG